MVKKTKLHYNYLDLKSAQASTLEPSWGPGHCWEPELEPEQELQLQPGPGPGPGFEPWPEPKALGDACVRMFPSGVSDAGKSIKLFAAALWDLDLTFLDFTRALIAPACALTALVLLACICCRPFLLCFLAKHMLLGKLGSTLLRGSHLCDQGFLMLFLCCFPGLAVCGVLLGLGHFYTEAHGS